MPTEIRGLITNAISSRAMNYLSCTADFTSATWNTVAAHEVFVVTGCARLRMWITTAGTLDSASDEATVAFGHDGDADAFIAATTGVDLVTGDLWYDATPTLTADTFSNVILDWVVNGNDIGYTVAVEALNAGSLVFHCAWEPMSADGNVTVGLGGAFA